MVILGAAEIAAADEICTVKVDALILRPAMSSEFNALMANDLKEEAACCCLAGVADKGDKVLVTQKGPAYDSVKGLDGRAKGVVGEMSRESLGDCR